MVVPDVLRDEQFYIVTHSQHFCHSFNEALKMSLINRSEVCCEDTVSCNLILYEN